MSFKVYLYKYESLLPIVLLASTTTNEEEEKIYEKYYIKFYEILFSKNIIDEKSILIFCNFKNDTMKKQLQIQGSIKSDQDIVNDLNKDIKNIDFTASQIINDYSANFLIEIAEGIKIKTTNTKLNLLQKLSN